MEIIHAKKYLKLGYKKIINFFNTWIFLHTGLFTPRPMKVYYLISNKCNFQCQICPQWQAGKEENQTDYISEERMKEIINEMSGLGIKELGISGGEPLIYKEKTLALLEYANREGFYTHFATNGSLLNEEVLSRYNQSGGGHISLSVDAIGVAHDNLRGFQGAFESVSRVLSLFSDNKYKNILLKINFTLNNDNLSEAANVVRLAIKHRALIFIQPYSAYDYGHKNIAEKESKYPLWVKSINYGVLDAVVKELAELKRKYPDIILNDEKHLLAMYDYFTKSEFSTKCLAAFDQITINPQGKIIFCKYNELWDLKKDSLNDYLKSRRRQDIINASLKCDEGCLLGCMFRPSLKDLLINGIRLFKRS
jgi:MoaA/NifB/PqqE/SkfB family radical SAM enzyme